MVVSGQQVLRTHHQSDGRPSQIKIKSPRPVESTGAVAPSLLSICVVVFSAQWSGFIKCSASDTVGELRRRAERAAGVAPSSDSSYLLVEQTNKPLRDQLWVRDYGLDGSLRLLLITGSRRRWNRAA